MNDTTVMQLFERLSRLTAATKQHTGDGTTWDYTFPDGETHRYVIRGLKSHSEVEDSAFNLLIWVWNAKDYLKRWAELNGKVAQVVEDAVNSDECLMVCADLANLLKHGALKHSRSGQYPRFGVVSFEAPQAAIGSLTIFAFAVEIGIANPSLVEFRLPVVNNRGILIGDAFKYAEGGVAALERVRTNIHNGLIIGSTRRRGIALR